MTTVRVDTPDGGWFDQWQVVFDLVDGAGARIVLIGGLMTELHALIAGIDSYRPTDDVDFLINLMDPASTVGTWHSRLLQAGFALQPPVGRRGLA